MAVELEQITHLLQREYLYQKLTTEQLLWVAAQFKPVTLDANTVVFSQGAPGDCFYTVFSGKVRVTIHKRGEDHSLNLLGRGDYFGEEALLYNRPRTATLTTTERSVLLRMERDKFMTMLAAYPQIKVNMDATAESRQLARSRHFDWLGEDEVIYYMCRKHEFFLYTALILPILFGVAAFPVLSIGFVEYATPFTFSLVLGLGIFMLVGAIAWGIWSWLDWGNDYYIVTSQRVVWLEKIIGLYDSRNEAPLETILAVNVTSSQLGRIFKYGTVIVRTYTGGISMRRASQPYLFASFIEGFKTRVKQISREEEAQEMQKALDDALMRSAAVTGSHTPNVPVSPPPTPPPQPEKERPRMTFREKIQNFLKVRYEKDGVITYRKHWFVLFKKAWFSFLVLTGVFILLLLYFGERLFGTGAGLPSGTFVLGLATPISIIFFLWLAYEYLDWRNDIYRLTADQILDIEKKPLGQETKKTAPLESILSIEHERANIIGIMLNFGTVTINVGDTRFIFYHVFNPDQVHSDISDYREALNRRKRAKEKERERDQMINWLVTYYNETEKLE